LDDSLLTIDINCYKYGQPDKLDDGEITIGL
jgi:hypothetical protein